VPPDQPLSVLGSTALAVAACRATESIRIDAWFHDELAQHVLASAAEAVAEGVAGPALSRGLVRWVAVRTRFLDELVEAAVADGVRQVVIVGAGLDARAFRLALPRDLTVFEIDHAEVISFKQRLLDELELMSDCRRRVVIADLVTDDWLQLLTDTGWAPSQPTVWVAEGLLVYLNHDERTHLLRQLCAASDGASVLGATLGTRTDNLAHPLWHPASAADPVEWLADCGWQATVQTMAEASAAYGRPLPPPFDTSSKGRLVRAVR
jgi:methyltransferase (TIGR00027 family)